MVFTKLGAVEGSGGSLLKRIALSVSGDVLAEAGRCGSSLWVGNTIFSGILLQLGVFTPKL